MCAAWVGVGGIREVQLVARGAQQGCTAPALSPSHPGSEFLGSDLDSRCVFMPCSFPPTRKAEGGTKLPGVDCWGLSQAPPPAPAGSH